MNFCSAASSFAFSLPKLPGEGAGVLGPGVAGTTGAPATAIASASSVRAFESADFRHAVTATTATTISAKVTRPAMIGLR